MSSEVITRNDLEAIFNAVLPAEIPASNVKLNDNTTVQSQFDFEVSTTTMSITTGTLNSHIMCRMGRLRFLRISVSKTSATAVGANLFQATITNSRDIPAHFVSGVGYYGSACLPAQIAGGDASDAGTITVRVTGAQVAANAPPWISFVYVAKEE
jgi:hypothetical protein